jgi:hypothetical protein
MQRMCDDGCEVQNPTYTSGIPLCNCLFKEALMSNGREYDKPALYEFVVKGKLDSRWSRWFAGMQVIPQPDGCSLITGLITDQAALYGVISRLRDLGTVLISVQRVRGE